jgi:hypothetical protein
VLPVPEGTTVGVDDIAAVVALPGAIGVFWNSHVTSSFYFAVHADGLPATDPAAWRLEVATRSSNVADDHMNLKVAPDGRVFAVVKTDRTGPDATTIGLLVRSTSGVWSPLYKVASLAVGAVTAAVPDRRRQRPAVRLLLLARERHLLQKQRPERDLVRGGHRRPVHHDGHDDRHQQPDHDQAERHRGDRHRRRGERTRVARYWHNTIGP